MLDKIKEWLSSTGLTSVGYAAGFIGSLILAWPYLAGACAGIFVYVNFNIIRKLIINGVSKL